MSQSTPTTGSRQLSSSLKNRLKKCGRYHSSPKPAVSTSPHNNLLSSSSVTKTACKDPELGTPVRKRSSSPLTSRVQKKRQILKSTENENSCTNFEDTDLSHVSSPADNCSDETSDRAAMAPSSSSSLFRDKGAMCHSQQSTSSKDEVEKVVNGDLNLHCNPERLDNKCRTDKFRITEPGARSDGPQNIPDIETDDRLEILKELPEKNETLRQLRMVQMYRSKNDLDQLQSLINKWRSVVQQALPDLHTEMTVEPKPSLTQLIDHLGIDHDFIQYDPDEESFGL